MRWGGVGSREASWSAVAERSEATALTGSIEANRVEVKPEARPADKSGVKPPQSETLARSSETQGLLGVGEFFVAAVVAAGVDEFLGGGEIGGGGFPRILLPTGLTDH